MSLVISHSSAAVARARARARVGAGAGVGAGKWVSERASERVKRMKKEKRINENEIKVNVRSKTTKDFYLALLSLNR